MKRILIVTCLLYSFQFLAQNAGEWTWMSGSTSSGLPVYGTQGVPAPNVTPGGGSVYESRFWTDLNGNFWLFGGVDIVVGGQQDNMWKYDVSTNQWTWMKGGGAFAGVVNYGTLGVFSNSNNPPMTGFGDGVTWTDLNGDLWLFTASGENGSSMWKYNIALNQWAWMHGNFPQNDGTLGIASPLNNPGYIAECPISWVDDAGFLWFLDGYYGGVMWKYDTNSNQWTRMHGVTDIFGNPIAANYGTKGIFSVSNFPGTRWSYQYWKSDQGKFYMFGTASVDGITGEILNKPDVWAFDPSINQWAWVAGVQSPVTNSTFTTLGTFSSTNLPMSSIEEVNVWKDGCGRFWGYNISNGFLWCYDPVIDQFAWMDGDLGTNAVNYGTQGLSSPLNQPSGFTDLNTLQYNLWGMPHWQDQNGNFWMLQSLVDGSSNTSSVMWRYVPPSSSSGSINFSVTPDPLCLGNEAIFTPSVASQSANYQWNLGDGTTSEDISPAHSYSATGTYHVSLIFTDTTGCVLTDTSELDIIVGDFSSGIVSPPLICKDSAFQLEAYGGSTYLWSPATYLDDPAISNPTATVNETTLFTVIITDSCGSDTLSVELKVKQSCEDMTIEPTNVFTPNKDQDNDLYYLKTENVKVLHLVIFNRWGQKMFDETAESPAWNGRTPDGKEAVDGVYFYTYQAEGYNGEKSEGQGYLHLLKK